MSTEPLYEISTWKYCATFGVADVWQNTYVIAVGGTWHDVLAAGIADNIQKAERELHLTDVRQLFTSVRQFLPGINEPDAGQVHSYGLERMCFGDGGAGHFPLDFRYGLRWNKAALYGRGAGYCWRRALHTGGVFGSEKDGYALKTGADSIGGALDYATGQLNAPGFIHQIVHSWNEVGYPPGTTACDNVTPRGIMKLQSVTDAQLRKTTSGRNAQALWKTIVLAASSMFKHADVTYLLAAQNMASEHVAQIATDVGNIRLGLVELSEYWEDGLEPEVSYTWRPTSGLDPGQLIGAAFAGKSGDLAKKIAEDVQEIVDQHTFLIPKNELDDAFAEIELLMWQIGKVGVCRFTGTPLRPPEWV
jgi:hypothetical protein